MTQFLGFLWIVIIVFAIIAGLQATELIPKRCHEFRLKQDENGRTSFIDPPEIRCYIIWHPYFWARPAYL